MVEITNEVYLRCTRTAVELTEKMSPELLIAEFKHMPIETQRAICAQYLAHQLFDELGNIKPKEEG